MKIPFSSSRKRGSIVVKTDDDRVRVYCKGAPDFVLKDTTNVIGHDGAIISIDDDCEVH